MSREVALRTLSDAPSLEQVVGSLWDEYEDVPAMIISLCLDCRPYGVRYEDAFRDAPSLAIRTVAELAIDLEEGRNTQLREMIRRISRPLLVKPWTSWCLAADEAHLEFRLGTGALFQLHRQSLREPFWPASCYLTALWGAAAYEDLARAVTLAAALADGSPCTTATPT